MSEALHVDGVTYLPLKQAAKAVSYTRDYVARLAREQKIIATQIGRQWYVDPESLQRFAANAEIEFSIRREQLQQQRRHEREVMVQHEEKVQARANHLRQAPQRALAFTLAVFASAVIGGISIHTTGMYPVSPQAPRQLSDVSQVINPGLNSGVTVAKSENSVLTSGDSAGGVDVVRLDSAEHLGMLLLPAGTSLANAAEFAQLFSDPVEIVRTETGLSEIRLESQSNESGLPVVFVPVHITSNEGEITRE